MEEKNLAKLMTHSITGFKHGGGSVMVLNDDVTTHRQKDDRCYKIGQTMMNNADG